MNLFKPEKILMKKIAKKGGSETLKRYGKEHFSGISGKGKGGSETLKRYGKEHFAEIGRKGRENRKRKDPNYGKKQTNKDLKSGDLEHGDAMSDVVKIFSGNS